MSLTILVVGAGGREHALAARLSRCPSVARVVVTPGNGGTSMPPLESRAGNPVDIALELSPDLVVIGPEQPLCDGLTDKLSEAGLLVYGPTAAAAQLESSKAFMKDFAVRHGIRTARHRTVDSSQDLEAALAAFDSPPVVKATGLCAGKGVVVAESFQEARGSALAMLSGEAFGSAGTQVVLEERLRGQEVSIHAVCDGARAWMLPPIQDHKRIGEGDTGPNTGGMGTYGPPPVATEELLDRIRAEIVEPVVTGMKADGTPFVGTLFAGIMVTEQGEPMLLEINVRFGDPETQVLMELVDGDFARLLVSAARGQLEPEAVSTNGKYGVCVVLAAEGYPAAPRQGDAITGIESARRHTGVEVFHAGTRRVAEEVVSSGGRVLGVTATANSLSEASACAYAACREIHFEGMQYRRDIGFRALGSAVANDGGSR